MNLFNKNKDDETIKTVVPRNFGWLEKKLNQIEIDYLWNCVKNKGESMKKDLIGNIHESNVLVDRGNWFFNNTLRPLCDKYDKDFENLGNNIPVNQRHPYYLNKFWVNYQKQNEFNPIHNHTGIYSFVVWMKIPTKHREQNKNPISFFSNSQIISSFQFYYTDILGRMTVYTYEMNPEVEGTILFFPSELHHQVFPYFNCNDDRISISGNILLNTTKTTQ